MNSLQKAKVAVISGITICVASLGFIAISGAQSISKKSLDRLPHKPYGLSQADDCAVIGGGKSCLKTVSAQLKTSNLQNLPAIAIILPDVSTTQLIKGDLVLAATQ
ncbi:MAG: hypothetical protein OIF58_14480 [Cohaesibacter sp.]|nr:hypothetical protein [Cohaesibacter sp.]